MMPLSVIDSHFHVWDLAKQQLPWLHDVSTTLRFTHTVAQLLAEYDRIEDIKLLGLVHVEADTSDPALENELIHSLISTTPQVKAFIAHAHLGPDMQLTSGAVGVREALHIKDSMPGRCLQPEFIAGLRVLAAHDLTFDAVVRPDELRDLEKALTQVPEITAVIDHLGNVENLDANSRAALQDLATLPNIFCKISGLSYTNPTHSQNVLDFFEETFGRSRLMYASNWPVIALYSQLEQHLTAVRNHFDDDPEIFRRTAARAYNLKGIN